MEEFVEQIAESIRSAYDEQSQLKGYPPLLPWDEMPEPRKDKWRLMARAAIKTIQENN